MFEKLFAEILYKLVYVIAEICLLVHTFWIQLISGEIITMVMSAKAIQDLYGIIAGMSISILIVMVIIKVIKLSLKNQKKKINSVIMYGLYGFIGIGLLGTLMIAISHLIGGLAFGINDGENIGFSIIKMGFDSSIPIEDINKVFESLAQNSIPTFSELSNAFADTTSISNWYSSYNMFFPIFAGVPVLLMSVFGVYNTAKRIFEIMTLYILSPLCCAMYPIHEGDGLKNLIKDFLAASLTGLFMFIGYLLSGAIGGSIIYFFGTSYLNLTGTMYQVASIIILCLELFMVVELTNKLAEFWNLNIKITSSISGMVTGVSSKIIDIKNNKSSTTQDDKKTNNSNQDIEHANSDAKSGSNEYEYNCQQNAITEKETEIDYTKFDNDDKTGPADKYLNVLEPQINVQVDVLNTSTPEHEYNNNIESELVDGGNNIETYFTKDNNDDKDQLVNIINVDNELDSSILKVAVDDIEVDNVVDSDNNINSEIQDIDINNVNQNENEILVNNEFDLEKTNKILTKIDRSAIAIDENTSKE